MLAAIGIILILKQFPHLVGYDVDAEGDESFLQPNDENTFSGIWHGINYIAPAAVIIGAVALFFLYVWELRAIKKIKLMQLVPAPLVVVSMGIGINAIFASNGSTLTLNDGHLVTLPVAKSFNEFFGFLNFPELQYLTNPEVWKAGLTIAIVASLETLLGVEAVDKLDPLNRVTPTNRELKAQGMGNMVSGLLGGIPVTSVIVRSSANVNAGAKSKFSTIMHGILMLLFVAFLPGLLNQIPLSALAAILIFTGYKLARVALFREFYKKGWDQFAPFVITIISILLTDL
jgi:MFS superfamily sulfate permease-like transporter